MHNQKEIIAIYKCEFPKDTLTQISQRTEIQVTRVFRLLNGAEMKVSEYERFYTAIYFQETNLRKQARSIFDQSIRCLPSDLLQKLIFEASYSLKEYKYLIQEELQATKQELQYV